MNELEVCSEVTHRQTRKKESEREDRCHASADEIGKPHVGHYICAIANGQEICIAAAEHARDGSESSRCQSVHHRVAHG